MDIDKNIKEYLKKINNKLNLGSNDKGRFILMFTREYELIVIHESKSDIKSHHCITKMDIGAKDIKIICETCNSHMGIDISWWEDIKSDIQFFLTMSTFQ